MNTTVLIIDDEPSICWALEQAFLEEGYAVVTAATAEDGLRQAAEHRPAVVMMDVRMPGMDGLEAMQHLSKVVPSASIIMMTAFGNLETAVRAVSQGAYEYLTKPFDLQQALDVVVRACEVNAEIAEDPVSSTAESLDSLLIGSSPQMQQVFRKIALVAAHDVPVLVTGESGTGKELVSHALHVHGRRPQGPFIPVCVPALSDALVESELFGHRGGAFTGATADRSGLLRQAHGGTAFFDEIGDVSLATQVKLLRVLETKQVTPVGANEAVASDFRLVAATNRNLEEMVRAGEFREDLYYRLNVYRIDLPPLRDRPDDIPLLAQHFLNRVRNAEKCVLSPRTLDALRSRRWFGNVRELRNAIEHAAIVSRGNRIEPDSLPPEMALQDTSGLHQGSQLTNVVEQWLRGLGEAAADEGLLNLFLQEVEPVLFRFALTRSGGNRQEAAKLLGMHRQTLREKLRKYGIDDAGE